VENALAPLRALVAGAALARARRRHLITLKWRGISMASVQQIAHRQQHNSIGGIFKTRRAGICGKAIVAGRGDVCARAAGVPLCRLA